MNGDLEELISAQAEAEQEAPDLEKLTRGSTSDRAKRARGLKRPADVRALWSASTRALSVQLALLSNPAAPEEVLWAGWRSAAKFADLKHQPLDREFQLLKALAANERLPAELRDEIASSCAARLRSGGVIPIWTGEPLAVLSVTQSSLPLAERQKMLNCCLPEARIGALAQRCSPYSFKRPPGSVWELIELQASDLEVIELATGLVCEAARMNGAVRDRNLTGICDLAGGSARAVSCCSWLLEARLQRERG